jgi:hypothetical protein
MRWLFQKIGIRSGNMFETYEAIRVGDEIRRELAASLSGVGSTTTPHDSPAGPEPRADLRRRLDLTPGVVPRAVRRVISQPVLLR